MKIKSVKLSKLQASILFRNGEKYYKKLKANDVALFSSTPYKQANLTIDLIRSLYKNKLKQQIILDANSNIGAGFMELAYIGAELHGVELNPTQFKALVNNVEVLLGRRKKLYLTETNIIKYLTDHDIFTIAFFDPPWRDEFKVATIQNKILRKKLSPEQYKLQRIKIPLYYEYKSRRYSMADVVNMSNIETVLFKVPEIYDTTDLKRIKAKYNTYTFSIKEKKGSHSRILFTMILLTKLKRKPDGSSINQYIATPADDIRCVSDKKCMEKYVKKKRFN